VLDLALLLSACIVLAIAAGSTTALLRPDSVLDAAITFGVVGAAGVAVQLLVAGAPGGLSRGVVGALDGAWAAGAAVLVARRGEPPFQLPRFKLPRLRPDAIRSHPWEAAVVALAFLALAWQLLVALVLPPFAFDALTYHLTTVATWLKEGNLDPTPLSLCCAYYPANAELMFTWPMLFLGSDALVDTVQIGFAVLAALAVAGIARSAGLSRWTAAAAGGLFVVTPIVLAQAPTNYADVIVTACALAALHSLVRFAVTGAPQRLVVAGLASGLVLGTKGTGIIWALVLALGALVLVFARRRAGTLSSRAAASALVAFAAAALALGSYWYARNWIEQGNPVYPFRVEVAGMTAFHGPLRVDDVLTQPDAARDDPLPVEVLRSWAADLDFWHQGSYDYQQRAGGLGPLWPWLALPLLLPMAVVLARRRSSALIALVPIALVFAVQPYRWWSRFTIPLMAVGVLAIACAAVWAPRPWMRRAVQAAALALALAGVALCTFQVDPAARARPLPARKVLGLVGEPRSKRTVERLFFPEYRFLDRVPDDATVVVDLRALPVRFVYPLFGPEHTRDVLAVGSEAPPPGAWVVTADGRALDRLLGRDDRFMLTFAARGERVWRPAE
jgi:hypothetical protein